ncbi:hypothetical protein AHAS_Ahas14G0123900 [Arachis hypogaea]
MCRGSAARMVIRYFQYDRRSMGKGSLVFRRDGIMQFVQCRSCVDWYVYNGRDTRVDPHHGWIRWV